MMKNKVGVRIAGKEYTLVGIESDEYIQKVALYIDKKMNEIVKINSKLSTSMAAVLAAVNVADDFFKTHENEVHLKKELKYIQEEVARLREENKQLVNENAVLANKANHLQLELVKREAELNEVRNSTGRTIRSVV